MRRFRKIALLSLSLSYASAFAAEQKEAVQITPGRSDVMLDQASPCPDLQNQAARKSEGFFFNRDFNLNVSIVRNECIEMHGDLATAPNGETVNFTLEIDASIQADETESHKTTGLLNGTYRIGCFNSSAGVLCFGYDDLIGKPHLRFLDSIGSSVGMIFGPGFSADEIRYLSSGSEITLSKRLPSNPNWW